MLGKMRMTNGKTKVPEKLGTTMSKELSYIVHPLDLFLFSSKQKFINKNLYKALM